MPLTGNSENDTKVGLQSRLYHNLGAVDNVGRCVMTAAASGSWTANSEYSIPVAGVDLVLRTRAPIASVSAMVVTITGTKVGGGDLTGTATITARAPKSWGIEVTPSEANASFLTVTDVDATHGVAGDGFDVLVLPTGSNTLIGFTNGFSYNEGTSAIGVRRDDDPSADHHTKKQVQPTTMSVGAKYLRNTEGLSYIADREVTLIRELVDDKTEVVQETEYFSKTLLGPAVETPEDKNGFITASADGAFARRICFS